MKRTATALTLFLLPVLLAVVFDLFILPIDFFMFRSWETLSVHSMRAYLPGPFYPNQHLQKMEQGDIGHHTQFAVLHPTTWTTDAFGYRYAGTDNGNGPFDVVIVGTSFVVGSGLSESQTFDRQLAQQTGLRCYPYAPRSLRAYIGDARFLKNPPAVVVWATLEPYVSGAMPAENDVPYGGRLWPFPQSWIILIDRFTKYAWIEYLQAHAQNTLFNLSERIFLGRKYPIRYPFRLAKDGSMLFIKDYLSYPLKDSGRFINNYLTYPAVTDSDIVGFADTLKKYEKTLAQLGTRLVFCPIPRKSIVYYDRVPWPRPTELPRLIDGVRARGIPAIDLLSADWAAISSSPDLLYQTDDTHWNERGVAIAAALVAQWIQTAQLRFVNISHAR